jgi:hypothetical protein
MPQARVTRSFSLLRVRPDDSSWTRSPARGGELGSTGPTFAGPRRHLAICDVRHSWLLMALPTAQMLHLSGGEPRNII